MRFYSHNKLSLARWRVKVYALIMIRKTAQRRAIRRVLAEAEHPMSPLDILNAARKFVPTLGLATVYRTLKGLVSAEEICYLEMPGSGPFYEKVPETHHHHFRCRKCSRLYNVEGCPLPKKLAVPKGFKLEGHHLLLFGTCGDCKKK